MKKKLKRIGVGLLAALTLVMGMLSGATSVFAADDDTMGKAYLADYDKASYKQVSGGVYALYSDSDCTNELCRVTTPEKGEVELGTFVEGIYYLRQIAPPKGYVHNNAIQECKIQGGRNTSTWILNQEQKAGLYIYHKGERLVGWDGTDFVYEMQSIGGNAIKLTAAKDIYRADGTKVYSKGDVVKERVEPKRTGVTSITGLTHGTYAVTELEDMEGYRKTKVSHTVTLSYDDNPWMNESFTSLTIQHERQKATISVGTEDSETGTKLYGGEYTLYAGSDIRNVEGQVIASKGVALETVTADENGEATFTVDIPSDRDFYVAQSEAPTGYARNTAETKSFFFNCSALGHSEDVSFVHNFGNDRTTAKIQLCITDETTREAKPEGDASFEGAVYGLYAREDIVHPDGATGVLYKAGDLVTKLTTDANGEATVTDLYLGKYYTKELTSSEGYRLDEREREVNCNYEGDLIPEVSRRVESHQIIKSQPIQVIIGAQHKDNTQIDLLEGAGFMMYLKSEIPLKEDGSYDFEKATPVPIGDYGEIELFTGEDGSIFTYSLPYGTYVVVESTTPEKTMTVEPFEVQIVENSPKQPQVWKVLTVRYIDEVPEEPMDDPVEESVETPTEEPKEEPKEEPTETPIETTSPKTGDETNVWVWVGAGVFAVGAVVLLASKKKDKRK